MMHLQFTPDRRLHNHEVEDLLRALAGMYRPLLARWNGRGFSAPARAAWEILLGHRAATFALTIPETWEQVARKQAMVVWPGATLTAVPDPLAELQPTLVSRLGYRHHYMFGLRVDQRTLGILPSLLETTRMLAPGEAAAVQVLLDPAPPDWWEGAATGYDRLKGEGRPPARRRLDAKGIAQFTARVAAAVVLEAVYLVQEFLTGEEPERVPLDGPSPGSLLRDVPMGESVARKVRCEAFDLTVRLGVQAGDRASALAIQRALHAAFRAVDGDNSLLPVPESPAAWRRWALTRRPGWKTDPDYAGTHELTMLVGLPTAPLQEQYHLTAVDHRETDLPVAITQGGLLLGVARAKGQSVPVYLPITNHDELCLPHVVIGAMGTGKSTFAVTLAEQAALHDFCAVLFDPAGDGRMAAELQACLPRERFLHVRFGETPVGLDWREATHSDRTRNRVANELIAFCDAAGEDAGAQTVRYLRSAAKVVASGRLKDVVHLLTDRKEAMKLLQEARAEDRAMWDAYWDDKQTTPARRTQLSQPVMNRLDLVLGDDYLEACLEAQDGLDFVTLLEEPRVILLDLPKGQLGGEALDVLAALLTTKLDLAMLLRREGRRIPCLVWVDEPHQVLRSARSWRSAVVESRKWRFSYCFGFHSWEQIPRELGHIIKAGGACYHLYASSKETFTSLKEEIEPWTVEEALRIPTHHALHVLRAGGRTLPPFLCQMAPPPSKRRRP